MKNLENLEVQELNSTEMRAIEGGSWFSDAWDWVVDHVKIGVSPSGHTQSF